MSESETAPTRELAAIMFSDIAGYSTIMGRDEHTALRVLSEHRELLRNLLPKYNGRMLGEIGDGTLTSFHSALDAVNCARDLLQILVIQRSRETQRRRGSWYFGLVIQDASGPCAAPSAVSRTAFLRVSAFPSQLSQWNL